MTNIEANVGKSARIVRTDNPFASRHVGKTGEIVGVVASCEPTYMIKTEDGAFVHAFARNVSVHS